MAYHVPYNGEIFRPVNSELAGNEDSDNPVEFDIVPAWGSDLARLKSIVYGSAGLTMDSGWSPQVQDAVTKALDDGSRAFVNTVEAIRGLTIPAKMALRAGLIPDLPMGVGENGKPTKDPQAPIPVTTGMQFQKIAGALPAMAFHVAMRIFKLSGQAEKDPRFFGQPSGSSATGTAGQGKAMNVTDARKGRGGRGTAARRSTKKASQTRKGRSAKTS